MFFPFMMDVAGKQIVIIGGGMVAYRKCVLFQQFGASLTINAPKICPELKMLSGVNLIQSEYCEKILEGAFAVIAATDDKEVNQSISAACNKRRIPVNVVDVPEMCSFIVPATVIRGDLILAASTSGRCPAFAARIRRSLETAFPEEYGVFLSLLKQIRELILKSGLPSKKRKDLLLQLAELPIEDRKALEEQFSMLQDAVK